MVRKKLLAYRTFSGIGDWMMALSVLKMVNIQFPDIDIYLNLKGKIVSRRRREATDLPNITNQIIDNFDVKLAGKIYETDLLKLIPDYDYVTGNMAYSKKDDKFFVESMVDRFNKNTGLGLVYMPDINAKYTGKPVEFDDHMPKPYILIQSCSKKGSIARRWKDYGTKNMQILANKLKKLFTVIQVGAFGDIELNGISNFLSPPLPRLHYLITNSLAFVGLDGMLGVFSSYHKVKHYIIYKNDQSFKWTAFPHRVQLDGNRNPIQLYQMIKSDLAHA